MKRTTICGITAAIVLISTECFATGRGIPSSIQEFTPAMTKTRVNSPLRMRSRTVRAHSQAAPPALTPMLKIPGTNTQLCGAYVYSDKWAEKDDNGNYLYEMNPGIYTIPARPDGDIVCNASISGLSGMIAGVKVNSQYYAITLTGSGEYAYLSTYSTTTWNRSSYQEVDIVNVPIDLTYDPVTKKCYGFFYNDNDYGEYSRFCSYSTYTGEATDIAEMTRAGFAIAANASGELYGIWGYTGWLVKIDPKTGVVDQIGRTGIYPGYQNSLTFDDTTGKLYWASNDEDGNSALYEVNTETGVATLIRKFADNDTYVGIYALPYSVPDTAPAAVTNLNVEFADDTALTGYVTCTAPTTSVNNATLSTTLSILIDVDGVQTVVEDVQPGAAVKSPLLTFNEGKVNITVTPCDANYRGEEATISTFAGMDLPGAPANVLLSDNEGIPTLTWEAPTAGANGGRFDASSLKYRVVRYPDAKVVATDLTDLTFADTEFNGMAAISYDVIAVNAKGESQATRSNSMVFGQGFTIPFLEEFATQSAYDLWTVVNVNGGSTWSYNASSGVANYKYDDTLPGDDWLISPKFKLEAGKTYELTFFAKTLYNKYPENFKFMLGTSLEPSSMTTLITDCPQFMNTKGETRRVFFTAPATGDFFLGVYCYSYATGSNKGWTLTIDNVGLSEVSGSVPAAVTDLSVTAAPQGALSATVAFTAPTLDSNGEELTSTMDINLYRLGEDAPATTFSDVAAGESLTWTDSAITASALMTYRVVPQNFAGPGAEATASAYVGVDVPGQVGDLKAVETDNAITLTWTAPTQGANGGWFDASAVTYRVVRSDGTILAESQTATSYSDTDVPATTQELRYYLVTPYVGSSKGTYANTPYEVYGKPYAAPATETFPAADMRYYPWISESDGPQYTWSLETAGVNPTTADYNGDTGLAMFISTEQTAGITGTFASPKFDISAVADPELSFMMYHSEATDPAKNDQLTVAVSVDGGEWSDLPDATFSRDNGTTGWMRHALSLESFKDAKYIRVRFSAKALGEKNIHLDNIAIDQRRTTDIAVASFTGASRIAAGYDADYTVKLNNNGAEAVSAAQVSILANGNVIAEAAAENIGVGASVDLNMKVNMPQTGDYQLTALCATPGDQNADNDSAQCSVSVVAPVIPSPFNLSGNAAADAVTLAWSAPSQRGAVTDDVESYTDWAIANVGDWSMVDRDMDVTYYINKDLESYPDQSSPKAFQVCNAATLGIDIWDEGTPHSGNKMFMSVASVNRANDDWLISPRLNGSSHTISFYAKSFTTDDIAPERMNVLYSMSDTDPVNFVKLNSSEYIEVPAAWTKYSYLLPEGAKYFAVNCVSEDSFALFVDDLSMNDMTVPNLTLSGYKVYRNGVEVATVTDTTYVDNSPVEGSADYAVAAIYDGVESDKCDSVTVQYSGINGAAAAEIAILVRENSIEVDNALGETITLYTMDGRVAMSQAIASQRFVITPDAGAYLVRVGDHVAKAIIR